MVAEKYGTSSDIVLSRNLCDRRGCHYWCASASKRAICHDVDPLIMTKLNYFVLGKAWMVLDLIDRWDDLGD